MGLRGRLGLAAAGTLAGIALAEVLLRLVGPVGRFDLLFCDPLFVPAEVHAPDPRLMVAPTPGFRGEIALPGHRIPLRFNRLGLRGPEPEEVAGAAWLAAGDSFTMALQVPEEEAFPARLGAAEGVHVWNAGVNGHSTWQALRRLEQVAAALPLQGVIVTLFLGNDLQENQHFHSLLQLPPGEPMPPPPAAAPASALTRLLAPRSALYATALAWTMRRDLEAGRTPNAGQWRDELTIFHEEGQNRLKALLSYTRHALVALREAAQQRRLRLLVAVAPPAFQVHPERAPGTFEAARLDPAGLRLDAPRQAALGELAALRIPACDLTPALTARAAAGERVHFPADGHWTPAGHAAVAQALGECLDRR